MTGTTLLPGQTGFMHDLEVSVPPILRGRRLAMNEIMMRANQVDHAIEATTGQSSWASGWGGTRDISFRFETKDQLEEAIKVATRLLQQMGYEIETTVVRPFTDEDAMIDMLEDLGDLPDGVASLVIERDIPVDADGDRVAQD
jgi:hypothetical protein